MYRSSVVGAALVVRYHVELAQRLDNRRFLERLLEGVLELGHDLRVHALRSGKPPGRVDHVRVAELLQRRNLGQERDALGCPDVEEARLASVDQRLDAGAAR